MGGDGGVPWFHEFERQDDNVVEVPFPWESLASGLRFSYKGVAWYRLLFTPQEGWGDLRVWLVVGAVSGDVRWWLNGKPIGQHTDGYIPFEVDVTDPLIPSGENDLVARVDTETDSIVPNADQKGGLSPSSGIWQTVIPIRTATDAPRSDTHPSRPRSVSRRIQARVRTLGCARDCGDCRASA